MVVELNSFMGAKNIGAKARFLVDANRFGYKTPRSIAIDTNEYLVAIRPIKDKIDTLMQRLSIDNIVTISKEINTLFDQVTLSEEASEKIISFVSDGDNYIIRSSIDSAFSFAGLLPVRKGINKNNVLKGIINCYKELFSYNTLSYIYKKKIDYKELLMAVIVQKELETSKYISIVTMNPVRLKSSEMTIDVQKEDQFEQYIYDYNTSKYLYEDKYKLISSDMISKTLSLAHQLQNNFGYPLEIELAISHDEIYVLQGKMIDKIIFDNYQGKLKKMPLVPKAFMYSLYKYGYDDVISKYMDTYDVSGKTLSLLFNGVYCDISFYENLFMKIMDYDANYFKYLYGISPKKDEKVSFKLKRIRRVNVKQIEQRIHLMMKNASKWCEEAHKSYNTYCHNMPRTNGANVENYWLKLVFSDYHLLAKHYLELELLIDIDKLLVYNSLKDIISVKQFEDLITVKDKYPKERIQKILYDLVSKINSDKESYHYWYATPTYKIISDYEKSSSSFYHPLFRYFIDAYGYLSDDETDLSSVCYVEDAEIVIRKIKKLLAHFTPYPNNASSSSIKKILNDSLETKDYNDINEKIEQLQELLIAKNYLKDYLSKFNFVVKRYTKMLAKYYLNKKIITNENDIWHLDINTINKYIDGEVASESLLKESTRQKLYYNAYANFLAPNFIGDDKETLKTALKGIGLSKEKMMGRAVIVKSINDLRNLRSKDILVTKTLSPNIIFKLPKIEGIIISDQYLNHNVKTLIRELDIPCIILKGCSKKISDGDLLEADGNLGYIKIVKQ